MQKNLSTSTNVYRGNSESSGCYSAEVSDNCKQHVLILCFVIQGSCILQ